MAALATTNPTLKDLASIQGPGGEQLQVVELLSQDNEMLDDMSWQEGNLPTGNVTSVRTGLPSVTWRKMYQGVQPSHSTRTQVTDTCGNMEAYSEIDCALARLNNMSAAWMMQEESAQREAINQELQRVLVYGNEASQSEAFTGLSPRYNSLSALNAQNIIVGDGAGTDNASIWLVYWHPNQVHGIVPKGSVGGIQRQFMGEVTIENVDGANGRMQAFRTHYKLSAGLALRDWRSVVRICNIDKSNLTKTGSTGTDLSDVMFQALEVIPRAAAQGRPCFYMNRVVMTKLRQQLSNKTSASTLVIEDVGGRKVYTFQGVPLRRVDAMAADEALVS